VDIGLIDVDSKIPNLVLMKISAHHKNNGDKVEWYNPMLNDWDIVYMSKVFKFTPDYQYPLTADKVVKGGSGYDLKTELPPEVENIYPDYNLYPNMDYAIGFTTRGCIRNCDFCIVPEKEGRIRPVGDIYDFWDGQDKLKLLDNNLTAHNEHYDRILNQMIKEKIKVDFSQGLDIRLITPKKAKLLSKVKLWKQIHFAFDNMEDEKYVRKGIEVLKNNGVKEYKLMFYVLIGFNTTKEEDMERIKILQQYNIDSFIMPYKDVNGYNMKKIIKRCGFKDEYKYKKYLKNFARWVNHKAIYRSVKWENYRR